MSDWGRHSLLPLWAQEMLIEASCVAPTAKDPRKTDKAVDEAIHEIRLRLPTKFRPVKKEIHVVCMSKGTPKVKR